MHWMIRAWRMKLMAEVKIEEVLAAFREGEKAAQGLTHVCRNALLEDRGNLSSLRAAWACGGISLRRAIRIFCRTGGWWISSPHKPLAWPGLLD